jgi:hypothetical protein
LAKAVLGSSLVTPQFGHAYAYVADTPINGTDALGLTTSQVLTQPTDTKDLTVTPTTTTSTSDVSFPPFVGLITVTYHTDNGDITVNLPSDMSQGDLISGTTVTLPGGAVDPSLELAVYGIKFGPPLSGGQAFPANPGNLPVGNTTVTLPGGP